MNEPVILIDIGNTNTKAAVAACNGRCAPSRFLTLTTHAVTQREAHLALHRLLDGRSCAGIVAASATPAVNPLWERAAAEACGQRLQWVKHDQPWNFNWRYPKPASLGSDRIINLCAAVSRYRPPLVVLDFGTALTVDMLNLQKEFIGGFIAPGFTVLAGAHIKRAALLPDISFRISRSPVRATPGKNTRESMRRGLLLGYRGLVREIIHAAAEQLGTSVTICATGGYAAPIMAALPDIRCHVHPRLTLEGLAVAYRLAAQKGAT